MSQNPGTSLQVQMSVGQGPDGKQWGVLVFAFGPTTWQIALPELNVKELNDHLSKNLQELYDALRRANLGLVLPTQPNGKGIKK